MPLNIRTYIVKVHPIETKPSLHLQCQQKHHFLAVVPQCHHVHVQQPSGVELSALGRDKDKVAGENTIAAVKAT